MQKFGTFLSNMVLPNIGAFIAWGLITALFIQDGWITLIGDKIFGYGRERQYDYGRRTGGWDADGGGIVGPMITYLLPILIGYTGGRMVLRHRGGVVRRDVGHGRHLPPWAPSSRATSRSPMFLGAMIMGPLGGWSMKQLDALWDGKIKPGFEMLVNNFSAGIWGTSWRSAAFLARPGRARSSSSWLGDGVDFLVDNNLLPLTSIFIEPAKVLFLNNAINHGVFTPLGIDQAAEQGKSVLFLLEANPGPGLGLLLAFTFFGKGLAKASAPGAAIIQFFGGIHEVYFPYVLMKPKLILAMILGGMTGVA